MANPGRNAPVGVRLSSCFWKKTPYRIFLNCYMYHERTHHEFNMCSYKPPGSYDRISTHFSG